MFNTIFCIDDDPISLMISKKIIAKAAFADHVITAKNGQEALDLFDQALESQIESESIHIDLIFLDLNMPVMGGWRFLELFTSDKYAHFNQQSKVVIISSTIDPQDLSRANNFSIVADFLPKPITVGMLEYLIEKLK